MSTLEELTEEIVAFRDERDWEQFHTPKELAAALSIEAAELQEIFLWEGPDEARAGIEETLQRDARREIADVLIYALLFCDSLGIDPSAAIRIKLDKNANKYPVEHAQGRATKYTRLTDDESND